jgi:hypothetical protein
MALEVVLARYFQMAALGADKRPIRERNHRHELVVYDTIRAPKDSLRHRCSSAGSRGQKRRYKDPRLKEPSENDAGRAEC